MAIPISEIPKILDAQSFSFCHPNDRIEHCLLDSRQIIFPKTTLFFAIKGQRHDGHRFLPELLEKGIRNFVVSEKVGAGEFPNANFIFVPNTLHALQQLATNHRHQFTLQTIGITGSNGKTIVKEWLFQLLQEDHQVVRSPKSYNSQIGVPLSVWQIQPHHDLGIFEAGISEMGEMEKLAPIIDCGIGIFTNIGPAHSAGFPTVEEKIRQKFKLFEGAKAILFCKDDSRVNQAMQELKEPAFFTWSKAGKRADLEVLKIFPTEKSEKTMMQKGDAKVPTPGTSIQAIFKKKSISIRIPFTDSASVENAIHCWALLLFLGYENEVIENRIAKLEPIAMRLELKEGIHNCLIINDSYNSDLTSLTIALNFLEQQSKNPKRTIILSDILQSGQRREQLYQRVARLLLEKGVERVIGIGEDVAVLGKILKSKPDWKSAGQSRFFKTTAEFLQQIENLEFREETILLKGARKFEFERIANRLSKKVHQTTLEVNLSALIHNLSLYHSFLKPGTKMMAMVKAAAYGSGSIEVAKLLEFQKVDYLGVAYADEGVELRHAGIRLPIVVLNPEEAIFDTLIRYNLEAEIYSLALLRQFLEFLEVEKVKASIHLKFDTGMHRLGFEAEQLHPLLELLKSSNLVQVQSVFSHLAASEDAAHDSFTDQQIQRFLEMYEQLAEGLGYRPMRHVLNSGGILRFPQFQMEMVRLGIGLYGIDGSGILQDKLHVVNTLKATISQIKNVGAGESVGYGREGRSDTARRIATVSLGYADGLLRKAGNGRYHVLIHNQKAPIVGNVCMDLCMVDVTAITHVQEGDEVLIFGKELPIEELASCLDTIPYEVFTSISDRVKRVYYQE